MAPRLDLQEVLESLLGSRNVYFQPPLNLKMSYPCIRYQRDDAETEFAGNKPYAYTKKYSLTYISQDPDSDVPDKIAMLPMCTFNRFYAADNLNHDVFDLFF